MHAAVAHVHAVKNGIPYRCAALDDSRAHGRQVEIGGSTDNRYEAIEPGDAASTF